MKYTDLENLVNEHLDELRAALREAEQDALRCPSLSFSVALFADGTMEERQTLAGNYTWHLNDPAVAEFGNFCYQTLSPLWDGYANSNELLDELLDWATPEERELFDSWRNETIRAEMEWYEDPDGDEAEYAPDAHDSCEWIEDNLTDLWGRLRECVICSMTDETDYDEIIYQELETMREYELFETE